MTQFTEAFYPVYNRTRAVLQDVKAGWKRLRELHDEEAHTPQLETLFMLHERYEVFSERLVQLEKLWGDVLRQLHCRSQYPSRPNLCRGRMPQRTQHHHGAEMKIEKTWITKAGYQATVKIMAQGHRCRYVTLPDDHPCVGACYDDLLVQAQVA